MTEEQLLEKLRLIENLFAGATTPGERNAAANAFERIKQRLEETKESAPPVEYKFSMSDVWSRKLFIALLRRYGIRPYRHTGSNIRRLWPEFRINS